MGIIRGVTYILAKLVDFICHPEEHHAMSERRWEKMDDQKREQLLSKYGSLELNIQSPDQVRRFDTLENAIDFVATCLERDKPSELSADIEALQEWKASVFKYTDSEYDFAVYFIEKVFLQWKEVHDEHDLRTAEYSEDQDSYSLRL